MNEYKPKRFSWWFFSFSRFGTRLFDWNIERSFNKWTVNQEHLEEVSVCPHCYAETHEIGMGDEGWTYCSDGCGCLEGDDDLYMTIDELEQRGLV